jgi:hypothetical protein
MAFWHLTMLAAGMFVSNMVLTTVDTFSRGWPAVSRWLGAITAQYSPWIGIRLVAN